MRLETLIASAREQGASDVHLEGGFPATFRVRGNLKRQGDALPAALLTSFAPDALRGAQAAAPHLPRGLLLDALRDGWLDTARQLRCVAIVCHHALWDAALVAQVKAAGWRALSYTVNDEWAAERLIRLGTDGIVTDRVDLFSPA